VCWQKAGEGIERWVADYVSVRIRRYFSSSKLILSVSVSIKLFTVSNKLKQATLLTFPFRATHVRRQSWGEFACVTGNLLSALLWHHACQAVHWSRRSVINHSTDRWYTIWRNIHGEAKTWILPVPYDCSSSEFIEYINLYSQGMQTNIAYKEKNTTDRKPGEITDRILISSLPSPPLSERRYFVARWHTVTLCVCPSSL